MIGGKILESRELRIENWERPGGAEDGDADGDGDTDGGEGVGGHLYEGVGPRARVCSCAWHSDPVQSARKCDFDFWISQCSSADFFFSFFSEKRSVLALSLSLSLTVARLTVTLRSVCECAIGFGGPLVLCFGFFSSERPLYVLGLSLLKRERNEMEMCTKETKSRFQLNFTRSCC